MREGAEPVAVREEAEPVAVREGAEPVAVREGAELVGASFGVAHHRDHRHAPAGQLVLDGKCSIR